MTTTVAHSVAWVVGWGGKRELRCEVCHVAIRRSPFVHDDDRWAQQEAKFRRAHS